MKLAEELRIKTDKMRDAKINADCKNLIDYVRQKAKEQASNGESQITIDLSNNWKLEAARLALNVLVNEDGFICEISHHIPYVGRQLSVSW